jgi:hypothetical protein
VSVGSSTLLGGRYRLDERMAVGGMGEVWRGRDMVLDRPVAVKLPAPGYAGDAHFRDRFQQEARHAASVNHPNIANVFDYGEASDDDPPYLVMELVEGEPLSAVIAREAPLPPTRVQALIGQVAGALAAAHAAGLVHRDIKPGNLLICAEGAVKVTDFGIARAAGEVPATATGQVLGTAQYLSPEQVEGRTATSASDLYALGVVAYECLAGRRPFDGEPIAVALAHRSEQPAPLPSTVPPALASLVMQMLEKDPARRPESALAVAQAARGVAPPGPYPAAPAPAGTPADTAPIAAVPGGRRSPGGPATAGLPAGAFAAPSRRRRFPGPGPGLLAAAAVVVTVLALVAVGLTLGGSGGHGHPAPAGKPVSGGTALTPVHPVSVSVLEPNGGSDDLQGASAADDGNLATAWETEWYTTAHFGNLKPGVGLIFDLGRPVTIKQVQVSLLAAGTGVQVWAGNSPGNLLQQTLVGSWPSAPIAVTADKTVTARYWLVWLDQLPPSGNGNYQSGIREVRFLR